MRAAIVIGVDKAGDLPILKGAASDAERVAKWLLGEGYLTTLLTDTRRGKPAAGQVSIQRIKKVVHDCVADQRGCEQLVIYFAGHGLNNFETEIWLLTSAPADADAAIDLNRNVELARDCGIGNVVFISDACRSNPDSPPLRRVRGSAIFPNPAERTGPRGKVDRFLPTVPNAAAFEFSEEFGAIEARAGIFTSEVLRAHGLPDGSLPDCRNPEKSLVRLAGKQRVVDLSSLAEYLEARVPQAAAEREIPWPQQPECIVETPPARKHLGRALFRKRPAAKRRFELGGLRGQEATPPEQAARPARAIREKLDKALAVTRNQIAAVDRRADHFETEIGVQVSGTRVVWAFGLDVNAEPLRVGDDLDLVRVTPLNPVGSVLIGFQGGRGTVVAALKGYIASVQVIGGRVSNVSYVPSNNSQRWLDRPEFLWEGLGELRALVAAKVKHGAFRLDRSEGRRFADRVRDLKGLDPTLGLYAAYAYHDAGRIQDVRSVERYMRKDLFGFTLLDVAILAHPQAEADKHRLERSAPFCPMLMRGWQVLPRHLKTGQRGETLMGAADYLFPALWTTFEAGGMKILRKAAERGILLRG